MIHHIGEATAGGDPSADSLVVRSRRFSAGRREAHRRVLGSLRACGPGPHRALPFYVAGPYDDARSVVRTLEAAVGEGNYRNYYYVLPMG